MKLMFIIVVISLSLAFFASYDSPYKYFDIETITDIVFENFFIPILIISLAVNYFLVYRNIIKLESDYEPIKRKMLNRISGFLAFYLFIVGLLFFITRFSVMKTNEMLGNRKLLVQGRLIHIYQHTGKGGTYKDVTIEDTILQRQVKLRVKGSFDFDKEFERELNIGHWGIIYGE